MKLEYFHDGSADTPLILIYGQRSSEFLTLYTALAGLGRTRTSVEVHRLRDFEGVAGCRLAIRVGSGNSGILRCDDPNAFMAELNEDGRDDILGLLEPFCECAGGFQWLISYGEISLVVSDHRGW